MTELTLCPVANRPQPGGSRPYTPSTLHSPNCPSPTAERSPYGPSPLGRPASETRAFLSPPTLMDGPPARLSPRGMHTHKATIHKYRHNRYRHK